MDDLFAKLELECKPYLDNDQFVFKGCSNNIIVLEKPDLNFESNENRKSVVDKNFAKFRCNGLWCRDIIDLETFGHKKKLKNHFGLTTTVYEVDKFIRPHSYTFDINKVFASGIHYFLTLKAAFHYVRQGRDDGDHITWTPSGQLHLILRYKDGKKFETSVFNKDGKMIQKMVITNFT